MSKQHTPTPLQLLSRSNGILSNIYALDNALRVTAYASALIQVYGDGTLVGKEVKEFLSNLAGKASDARFLNRFYIGFPASVEGYFAYASNDTSVEAVLGKLMALSMILYHPLEHGWWITTVKPKILDIDGNKWSLWSTRLW